ncbi:MAG: hypothetical protein WDN67_04560 [Candidatus Moraniibacteriota bacterium]
MDKQSVLAFLDGLSEEEFVLHGSEHAYEYLIPSDPQQGHLIPEYDQVAVYGTCSVEIALLYAVIRTPTVDWGWRVIDDPFHPHILVVGPERLQISSGYVHLVRRSSFTDFVLNGLACLAYTPVKPERAIPVLPDILELLIKQRRIHVLSYEEYQNKHPST